MSAGVTAGAIIERKRATELASIHHNGRQFPLARSASDTVSSWSVREACGGYASLLALLPPRQSNLSRYRAWRIPHQCSYACCLCQLGRRTISPVGNSYHPSLFAEFEGNDMKIDGRCQLSLRLREVRGRSRSRNDDHLQLHRLPNNERCTVASYRCHSSKHVRAAVRQTDGIS
jgi:hypothetical protein